MVISDDKSRVILSAPPSSATNYKAIEAMTNDIEAELLFHARRQGHHPHPPQNRRAERAPRLQFEIDGIGSFGELRRDEEIPGGAKVTLRLRREIYGNELDKMVNEHRSDDLRGQQWTQQNWGKMEPQMLAL